MNPILQFLMQLFQSHGQGGNPGQGQTAAAYGAPPALNGIMPLLLQLAQSVGQQFPQQGGAPGAPRTPGGAGGGGPIQRGIPSAQGFRGQGGTNMRRSPNTGGYAGPGGSEMTNPGMAYMSWLLGGGPMGSMSQGGPMGKMAGPGGFGGAGGMGGGTGGTMFGTTGMGQLPRITG